MIRPYTRGNLWCRGCQTHYLVEWAWYGHLAPTLQSQFNLWGQLCALCLYQSLTSLGNAPEMVPELCSVFSVTLRLLTLFREVKQNLTVTFKLQPCERNLITEILPGNFWASQVAWFSSQSLDCDPVSLPLLLQHLGFSSQLCACSVFFCTKELFVRLLSASPQEISCDGRLWGSFLLEERLQGADNRDTGGHKPQQLRKHHHLELSAQGGWVAGRTNHCLEWSGLIGQGNCSLENPQLLLTAEAFAEAGHCNLVVLKPGLWKLWMNLYHGGFPWVS